MVTRFDVVLLNLDPVVGSEIAKTRPSVIISPNEMNKHLRTVIIAPLTSTVKAWPSRVRVDFQGRDGDIALDQMRAVDKVRITRDLGRLAPADAARVTDALARMFAA